VQKGGSTFRADMAWLQRSSVSGTGMPALLIASFSSCCSFSGTATCPRARKPSLTNLPQICKPSNSEYLSDKSWSGSLPPCHANSHGSLARG
jgi:hypothetical protein